MCPVHSGENRQYELSCGDEIGPVAMKPAAEESGLPTRLRFPGELPRRQRSMYIRNAVRTQSNRPCKLAMCLVSSVGRLEASKLDRIASYNGADVVCLHREAFGHEWPCSCCFCHLPSVLQMRPKTRREGRAHVRAGPRCQGHDFDDQKILDPLQPRFPPKGKPNT